ncbi:MAG: response regulator transcription factor [Sideroxydans sp.]|nr:response regulator transcription factor [Sideroxydans sp.]
MQLILVVEDDSAMREHMLKLISEVTDIQVDAAADEAGARELMASKTYDLAILDIELGQATLSRFAGLKLAAEKPAKVVLFVSGTSDTTLRSLASYLYTYDFISKPFEDVDFLVKVKRSLEAAQLTQSAAPLPKLELPQGLERSPNNQMKFLWQGKEVQLSVTELGIVDQLARSFGTVVVHAKLESSLPTGRGANALASHIRNIRLAFRDKDPDFSEISTEPGRGYIWKPRA